MKIIAVVYATFAGGEKKRKPEKNIRLVRLVRDGLDLCDTGAALCQLSWQASWDDLHSYNSSLRSSHICFSYVHNFIIIFSRVYNEPIQRSAPTWLITLIGRVLDRYRRGEGFEFRFRLSFRNCKSCVFNFDDLHSYNSSLCSSFFLFIYS